jgi:hypothetical protein
LRILPVAAAEARFFGGRFFEGREVRCERDFGAMIFLSPARFHHAMAGLPVSRRRRVFHLRSAAANPAVH